MPNDTDTLTLFAYGFFALAGAAVLFAITGLTWLVATGQLLTPRPTTSTEAATPATRPAHDVLGVQGEEMPETA